MESDDTEFLDGLIGRPITVSDRVHLFALARRGAAVQAKPAFTEGHCEHKKAPGGCPLHNLHCGYPDCDRRPLPPPPAGETNE